MAEDSFASFPPRMRLQQAAIYLGISGKSLADRSWRLKHGIPAIKLGRALIFDRTDLDQWLDRKKERPIRMEDFAAA
jgi:hypothetical protein